MQKSIRYITRNDINVDKWDECISQASNGRIYAYSFYLDRLAKHWDALVYGDYEIVMPLPWNRKFKLPYLYQPPFTASLGIFGNNRPEGIDTAFIKAIPEKFKLIEISLNANNNYMALDGSMILRNNFVLDLRKPYFEIAANYKENLQRNIRKAENLGCTYTNEASIDEIIALAREKGSKYEHISEKAFYRFRKLFIQLYAEGLAKACGVHTSNGQLVASCVFFFSHKRAYYILVGNHPNSKPLGASHFLIDSFIKEYCELDLSLDFEGSDARNVAYFYGSFGAQAEVYPALRINHLPWWAKLLKKFKK